VRGSLSSGEENLSVRLAMDDAGCFELLMLLNGRGFSRRVVPGGAGGRRGLEAQPARAREGSSGTPGPQLSGFV